MRMIMFTHYEQFYFTDRLFVNKSTVHLHSYVPNLSTHHSYVPNLLKNMSAVWNYLQRYGMRQTQQKNLKSTMHKWVITLTPYILCNTTCYITGVMWLFGLPSQTSRHHNVVITFVVYTVCTHTVIRTSNTLQTRNGMDKSRGGSVRPWSGIRKCHHGDQSHLQYI